VATHNTWAEIIDLNRMLSSSGASQQDLHRVLFFLQICLGPSMTLTKLLNRTQMRLVLPQVTAVVVVLLQVAVVCCQVPQAMVTVAAVARCQVAVALHQAGVLLQAAVVVRQQ
jgi:hypothetical protein